MPRVLDPPKTLQKVRGLDFLLETPRVLARGHPLFDHKLVFPVQSLPTDRDIGEELDYFFYEFVPLQFLTALAGNATSKIVELYHVPASDIASDIGSKLFVFHSSPTLLPAMSDFRKLEFHRCKFRAVDVALITKRTKTFLAKFTNGQGEKFDLKEERCLFHLERCTDERGRSYFRLRGQRTKPDGSSTPLLHVWEGPRPNLESMVKAIHGVILQCRMEELHGS